MTIQSTKPASSRAEHKTASTRLRRWISKTRDKIYRRTRKAAARISRRSIRTVYKLEPKLEFTILEKPGFFDRASLALVDSPELADVIVGRRASSFTPETMNLNRLNVLWTHEPFFDFSDTPLVREGWGANELHVFNVFNRRVYTDNYLHCTIESELPYIRSEADLNQPFSWKKVVTLMAGAVRKAPVAGRDVSLTGWRRRTALQGHAIGWLDVYGKEWPNGVAMGEHRNQWRETKPAVLKDYNFCLCPENTEWDFYVTEKIWDAIAGNCMPVYWANGTIDLTIPSDLYLNAKDVTSFDEIVRRIEAITFAEFRDRMNELKKIANYALKMNFRARSEERAEEILLSFFRSYR